MTFCALKYIYSLKKRCRVELSQELDDFGIKSDEEFSNMAKQSFLDNRNYHTEVLVNSFDKPSELLISFIDWKSLIQKKDLSLFIALKL